jgi:hypothetical protein
MELINPRLTVQNTDQPFWLVRMEHKLSDSEHIDVQLKVPRSDAPVADLQATLIQQAMRLLQAILDARHN